MIYLEGSKYPKIFRKYQEISHTRNITKKKSGKSHTKKSKKFQKISRKCHTKYIKKISYTLLIVQ